MARCECAAYFAVRSNASCLPPFLSSLVITNQYQPKATFLLSFSRICFFSAEDPAHTDTSRKPGDTQNVFLDYPFPDDFKARDWLLPVAGVAAFALIGSFGVSLMMARRKTPDMFKRTGELTAVSFYSFVSFSVLPLWVVAF